MKNMPIGSTVAGRCRLPGRCRDAMSGLCLSLALATAAGAEAISADGDHEYQEFVARDLEPGSVIDMRNGRFRVANSKNSNPDETTDCETGPLRLNRYPLRVYGSAGVALLGGRFEGEVPQESDWIYTYCNSTAIGLWNSPSAHMEGQRIRRVWDGIRIIEESPLFRIDRVWLSEVRDDCLENDFLQTGLIKDSLFDGCFSAISLRSSDEALPGDVSVTVTLAGVLMRMQPYLYKGDRRQGFPVKADSASPVLVIHDSIIAMGDDEMVSASALGIGFDKISDCRNNLFLWTSDKAWPDHLDKPPNCFRVLQGKEARAVWAETRLNWINCHPGAVRFPDDEVSDPSKCDHAAHGGLY